MHLDILNPNQQALFPYLKRFRRTFYLVGGTAIALHIGHRRSIDFDLFRYQKLNKQDIRKKLREIAFPQQLIHEDVDQLHLLVNGVKTTFFNYPYDIEHPVDLDGIITIPDLLTLGAMKAFALGRRAEWKDYVDIFYLLRDFYSIDAISKKANEIFQEQFSEKLFRQQISFHKDIDYSEPVDFLLDHPSDQEIKAFLIEKAIDI
jgi:hypothetical protein